MKIMVINSGSSTLKFDVMDVPTNSANGEPTRRLAHGIIERIGQEAHLSFKAASGASETWDAPVKDHHEAVTRVIEWLKSIPSDKGGDLTAQVEAVGHRVVHGGARFLSPTLIDDDVLAEIERLVELAPLHNPAALGGIRAAMSAFGPDVPMVAVFDTAFHATLPAHAYTYALPHEIAERHSIRRYGFHGTAHEFMLRRYAELEGASPTEATIITLQLGNGCSVTAIRDGRSVDTSMGFTPLEGLVMGTRSGDVDPGIVAYLGRKEGIASDEVEKLLNERSGLLGLSARSGDMRDLLEAEAHDARAALAIEVFCYRARKYVGAYLAALGEAQAVVFGGGIGEHAPTIRTRILTGMEWCGLRLDDARNAALTNGEGLISADGSAMRAYVVPVDEAALIARHAADVISHQ